MIEMVLTTCKEVNVFKRTWRNEVICGKLLIPLIQTISLTERGHGYLPRICHPLDHDTSLET